MIAQILLDPDICPVEDAKTLAEYSGPVPRTTGFTDNAQTAVA